MFVLVIQNLCTDGFVDKFAISLSNFSQINAPIPLYIFFADSLISPPYRLLPLFSHRFPDTALKVLVALLLADAYLRAHNWGLSRPRLSIINAALCLPIIHEQLQLQSVLYPFFSPFLLTRLGFLPKPLSNPEPLRALPFSPRTPNSQQEHFVWRFTSIDSYYQSRRRSQRAYCPSK